MLIDGDELTVTVDSVGNLRGITRTDVLCNGAAVDGLVSLVTTYTPSQSHSVQFNMLHALTM